MKFIDTVTLFHKGNNGAYERKVIEGCYWYGDTRISNSGHGIVRDDAISVFFPKDVIIKYDLIIQEHDYLVKDMVQEEIASTSELDQYQNVITVLTVNENTVNSKLDNLLVTGK